MHSNTQANLKQLILTSWKDQWSEKEWSVHARRYLHTPSDVFHVADALVSQAFIGTAPNPLLVQYIWYGVKTGLFSYASVITAIAKHDDLHKVESTKELYGLLCKCLLIVNKHPLIEDSMDLCCSLRVILQWLLRNTEQYLKGVPDVFTATAEELLRMNCETLKHLTTGFRTSVLLTIARFEESGVWSHIETDLAVIKTSAGQNSLHAEITESCHYVSQLSRSSISPKPVNRPKPPNSVSFPISTLFMLEVKLRRNSEPEGIASQLVLLAQIHGLSVTDLLLQTLHSCFLGYIDAIKAGGSVEQEWIVVLLLRIPKIFASFKMSNRSFESDSLMEQKVDKFETDLIHALYKLKELDSLINCLAQLRSDVNWLELLIDVFRKHRLLQDTNNVQDLIEPPEYGPNVDDSQCQNPRIFLNVEYNIDSLINAINPALMSTDAERLLKTFQTLSPLTKGFNTIFAAAAATGHLQSIADRLLQFNEFSKSSSGENGKTAETLAALFDISFLMLCELVKLYSKAKVFGGNVSKDLSGLPFVQRWINMWWTGSVDFYNRVNYEADSNIVDTLIQILRGSTDHKLILPNWNEMCSNMPQVMMEFIIAKQKGFLSAADFNRACCSIRDNFPLAVSLAVIVVVCKNARMVYPHNDHVVVLETLTRKNQGALSPLYEERFDFFTKIVHHFASDLLSTSNGENKNACVMTVRKPAMKLLKDALSKSNDKGWIDSKSLDQFVYSYKYLGVATFTRQLIAFVLQESRLSSLEIAFDLVYSIFRIDLLSFTIYLMKNGLQIHFLSEPSTLIPPFGPLLAEMLVACLDNTLNYILLKKKSLIFDDCVVSPFLFEVSLERKRENLKVRRLLSCSTEHDLSSSNSNAELSPDNPLLVVFSDFICNLWDKVNTKQSSHIKEFAFTFTKLCLYSTPMLSRTIKQVLPVAMVKGFSDKLIEDSRELLFAASDLGNPEVRRIAAEAICHAKVED